MKVQKFLSTFLSLILCFTMIPVAYAMELDGFTTFTFDQDTVTVAEGNSANCQLPPPT